MFPVRYGLGYFILFRILHSAHTVYVSPKHINRLDFVAEA
jgi:hypothetical protein